MAAIDLSAGSILYEDTGGEGPVVVLCHGLLMTASLWDQVVEELGPEEVTLVFNDWCGAQLLVAEGWDGRVGRLVLASCETDDNYPPGLPGRVAALAARLPGGLAAAFPDSRFIEIPDSRTLIPLDQPRALAVAIATFVSRP